MAAKIVFLRHGHTSWNAESRLQGWHDSVLDDLGRRQMARAAKRLCESSFERIYASTLERAWESARILAASSGLDVVPRESLREQNLGSWEGRTWEDIEKEHGHQVRSFITDLAWTPEGGESRRAMWQRFHGAVEEIAAELDGRSGIVVTHGGPLLLFIYHVLGIPYGTAKKFELSNAGITMASRFYRKGWKLHCLNDTAHLSGETGGHSW